MCIADDFVLNFNTSRALEAVHLRLAKGRVGGCGIRDDIGEDGQEQCGGSEEDEAGDGVVAVPLAVGAYPNYDSSQDSFS